MDDFVVGKMYRRKNVTNYVSSTMLWEDPRLDYTCKKVGAIKLTTNFILLQVYIHEYKNNTKVVWHRVLTSEGIIGWANLYFPAWEEIKTT
jgi:hypothetical protein